MTVLIISPGWAEVRHCKHVSNAMTLLHNALQWKHILYLHCPLTVRGLREGKNSQNMLSNHQLTHKHLYFFVRKLSYCCNFIMQKHHFYAWNMRLTHVHIFKLIWDYKKEIAQWQTPTRFPKSEYLLEYNHFFICTRLYFVWIIPGVRADNFLRILNLSYWRPLSKWQISFHGWAYWNTHTHTQTQTGYTHSTDHCVLTGTHWESGERCHSVQNSSGKKGVFQKVSLLFDPSHSFHLQLLNHTGCQAFDRSLHPNRWVKMVKLSSSVLLQLKNILKMKALQPILWSGEGHLDLSSLLIFNSK